MSQTKPKHMYFILKAYPISSLSVNGRPLSARPEDPQHFLFVFPTIKAAMKWGAKRSQIQKITVIS